jgi:hypothetical protein
MRKPEQAPEPSIEEILASIRRIIADDTAAPGEMEREEPSAPVHQQAHPAQRPMPGQRRRPGEPGREDEVLELTEDFMLAEEAAPVTLREPAEPQELAGPEFSRQGHFHDPFSAGAGDDPYDTSALQQAAYRAEHTAEPARDPEPEVTTEGLANVMAEVQRYVDAGKPAEEAPKPTVRPLENWTQPQNDVFRSDPAPRPPTRWSARHTAGEPAKAPETVAARPASREEPPLFRKPSLPDRESWSQGVQMPVPEDGPSMPFASDDSADLPSPQTASFGSEAPVEWSAPPLEQITGEIRSRQPAEDGAADESPAVLSQPETQAVLAEEVQARAEKLAEKVVADFASDKLNAEAPVTDFLKGDKPLMEEITDTLADALAKVGPAIDEAKDRLEAGAAAQDTQDGVAAAPDDNAPPLSEAVPSPVALAKDDVLPEPPKQAAPAEAEPGPDLEPDLESFAPDLPSAPDIPNLDGGFISPPPPHPLPPLQMRVETATEPGALELPREDNDDDDLAMMPLPPQLEEPVESSPFASGLSGGQSRAMTLGGGHGRNAVVERFQPSAAAPRTLEDTVREMLRPMLAEWLNENMPRILNDAIREELAAAGIRTPRLDEDR